MAFMQLGVQIAKCAVDHAASFHRFALEQHVGPAIDVFIGVSLKKLRRALQKKEDPGPRPLKNRKGKKGKRSSEEEEEEAVVA